MSKKEGTNNTPGKDTDAEGAKISKNGSDYDIIIAKSSHDKDKTKVEWSNNGLFENDFYSNHVVEKTNENNKALKEANDLLTKELKIKSTETLWLLTNEQRAYRDNLRKLGLGYKGPCVISKANANIPKLYDAYELRDENVQLHVFDSEETIEDDE
ncbi:hypothetical protein Tco_0766292 [Tanacetum coccineum]